MGDGRWTTTVMMAMRGHSRGRKEKENTTIEGRRSREGPKDATQQPTNGGVQLEAEALAERRRQANGQHDNQRSSWGQWCDCNKAQSRQLRCGGSQACEMGEGGRPEMLRESNGQHYNQPIERGGAVTADTGR